MNKRRLLLFSVFALLHITTSERNLINGGYRPRNRSSYLLSNTGFLESEPHRVRLAGRSTGNSESTQLTGRGTEHPKIIGRERNRILTTPSQEIVGSQNFRERITVNRPASNNIYRSRFVSFSSRYNKQINAVNMHRFKDRHASGFNYDEGDRKKRYSLEHIERNTESYASRDILRKKSNYDIYTERKILPQKLVLDRNIYRTADIQNIRKIRTDKENAFNQFDTERLSGYNTHRNLDNESQKELRDIIISRNKASHDRTNLKYKKRVSKEINTRFHIRDQLNFLTDNRKRTERVHNREVNDIGRNTRNINVELREASKFRDYVRNTRDEVSRIQNIRRFDVNRREQSHNRRRSSEEKYVMALNIPIDSKINFDRKDENYSDRYNRELKDRLITDNNNKNRYSIDRERSNFKETNKRVNTVGLGNNNAGRYFEDPVIRNVPKNKLASDRRSFIERSLKIDNKRRTLDSLLMEQSLVRDQTRRSQSVQRNVNNELDRILRRDSLSFGLTSGNSGRDETRRKLTILRSVTDNIISGRRRVNRRDQNHDKVLNIINVRRSLENPESLRENKKRETIRTNTHTTRQIFRIVRTSIEDVNNQKYRSVRNQERSTNNRAIVQKVYEERRTKQSPQDRFIDMRRIHTAREKRYSAQEFFGCSLSRIQNINYGSYIFEMKWEYLFYALQFVYLLGIIMQTSKNNKGNKQNNRIVSWLTSAEHLKNN